MVQILVGTPFYIFVIFSMPEKIGTPKYENFQ
jgi:hypothetical protein